MFVPELFPSHNRTDEPGGEPEATGRLYLCRSSSNTIEADVLTIKQAAASIFTDKLELSFFVYLC